MSTTETAVVEEHDNVRSLNERAAALGPGLLRTADGTYLRPVQASVEVLCSGPLAYWKIKSVFPETSSQSDEESPLYLYPLPPEASLNKFSVNDEPLFPGRLSVRGLDSLEEDDAVPRPPDTFLELLGDESLPVFTYQLTAWSDEVAESGVAVEIEFASSLPTVDGRISLLVPSVVCPTLEALGETFLELKVVVEDGDELVDEPTAPTEMEVTQEGETLILEGSFDNPDDTPVVTFRPGRTQMPVTRLRRGDSHFIFSIYPPTSIPASPQRRDIVFALDASENMDNQDFERIKEELAEVLKELDENDRFALVTFGRDIDGYDGGEFCDLDQVEAATDWLRRVQPKGRPDVQPLLQRIQSLPSQEDRQLCIFLLAAGHVGNEPAILKSLDFDQSDRRYYTVGIGCSIEQAFLRRLALLTRGRCEVATNGGCLSALKRLLGQTRALLAEVTFEDTEESEFEADLLVPTKMTSLTPLGPVHCLGYGSPSAIRFRSKDETGVFFAGTVNAHSTDNPALGGVWAGLRVRELQDFVYLTTGSEKRSLLAELSGLASEYGILTGDTVLVDETDSGMAIQFSAQPRMWRDSDSKEKKESVSKQDGAAPFDWRKGLVAREGLFKGKAPGDSGESSGRYGLRAKNNSTEKLSKPRLDRGVNLTGSVSDDDHEYDELDADQVALEAGFDDLDADLELDDDIDGEGSESTESDSAEEQEQAEAASDEPFTEAEDGDSEDESLEAINEEDDEQALSQSELSEEDLTSEQASSEDEAEEQGEEDLLVEDDESDEDPNLEEQDIEEARVDVEESSESFERSEEDEEDDSEQAAYEDGAEALDTDVSGEVAEQADESETADDSFEDMPEDDSAREEAVDSVDEVAAESGEELPADSLDGVATESKEAEPVASSETTPASAAVERPAVAPRAHVEQGPLPTSQVPVVSLSADPLASSRQRMTAYYSQLNAFDTELSLSAIQGLPGDLSPKGGDLPRILAQTVAHLEKRGYFAQAVSVLGLLLKDNPSAEVYRKMETLLASWAESLPATKLPEAIQILQLGNRACHGSELLTQKAAEAHERWRTLSGEQSELPELSLLSQQEPEKELDALLSNPQVELARLRAEQSSLSQQVVELKQTLETKLTELTEKLQSLPVAPPGPAPIPSVAPVSPAPPAVAESPGPAGESSAPAETVLAEPEVPATKSEASDTPLVSSAETLQPAPLEPAMPDLPVATETPAANIEQSAVAAEVDERSEADTTEPPSENHSESAIEEDGTTEQPVEDETDRTSEANVSSMAESPVEPIEEGESEPEEPGEDLSLSKDELLEMVLADPKSEESRRAVMASIPDAKDRVSFFRDVIKADKDEAYHSLSLARAYRDADQTKVAVVHFQKYLRSEKDAEAYLELADAYDELGKENLSASARRAAEAYKDTP